jgi:hypothetical protein
LRRIIEFKEEKEGFASEPEMIFCRAKHDQMILLNSLFVFVIFHAQLL